MTPLPNDRLEADARKTRAAQPERYVSCQHRRFTMDAEKYNRSVTLLCPTCGSTQFSSSEPSNSEAELITCTSCDRKLTRDELIRENNENIDEHVKEIGKEVTRDLERELKKQLADALKGSNFIKIK